MDGDGVSGEALAAEAAAFLAGEAQEDRDAAADWEEGYQKEMATVADVMGLLEAHGVSGLDEAFVRIRKRTKAGDDRIYDEDDVDVMVNRVMSLARGVMECRGCAPEHVPHFHRQTILRVVDPEDDQWQLWLTVLDEATGYQNFDPYADPDDVAAEITRLITQEDRAARQRRTEGRLIRLMTKIMTHKLEQRFGLHDATSDVGCSLATIVVSDFLDSDTPRPYSTLDAETYEAAGVPFGQFETLYAETDELLRTVVNSLGPPDS